MRNTLLAYSYPRPRFRRASAACVQGQRSVGPSTASCPSHIALHDLRIRSDHVEANVVAGENPADREHVPRVLLGASDLHRGRSNPELRHSISCSYDLRVKDGLE